MSTDGVPAPEALLARAGFVRTLVRDLVRDEHEAEDVEQEVFLATLRKPTVLKGSATAWITVVARRLAHKLHRERSRRHRREQRASQREAIESAADAAARFELHRVLVDLVRRLPEGSRSVVLMRYFDNVTPKEIARQLDIPVSTVKTQLQRGLASLRADLDRKHDGSRVAWSVIALPWIAPQARGSGTVLAGVLMTKTKVVLAALVLLVGTLVTVTLALRDQSPTSAARAAVPSRIPVDLVARDHSDPRSNVAKPDSSTDLPPPVDLDACDRDLDLHGVVVGTDGTPIAGARIESITFPWRRIRTASWDKEHIAVPGATTRSAIDGTFSIRLSWGQAVTLRVAADGFATRHMAYASAGERVRVAMDPGVGLGLTVRYADGSPCSGVPVLVRELASGGYLGYPWAKHSGTSDAKGRVVFEKLVAGQLVTAQALVAPKVQTIRLPGKGMREVELVVQSTRVVTGRVTDAVTGLPIRGAQVRLARIPHPSVISDAAGHYRLLAGVDEWSPGLIVSAPPYAPGQAPFGTGGQTDFALRPGATVAGRLLGQDGESVVGARVVAVRLPDCSRSTSSGEDGRFELTGLTPEEWHTLVVTASGHARTLIDFRTEQSFDFGDLTLGAPGVIEGRVLDEDGTPLLRTPVTLENAGWSKEDRHVAGSYGTVEMRFTDDLGRFRFTDQPDGMHKLSAQPERGKVTAAFVRLDNHTRHARADLRFKGTTDYVIRVRDEHGNPLVGVRVGINMHGGKRVSGKTDAQGESRIRVADGIYSIYVVPPGRQYLRSGLRHAQPGQLEYDFVLDVAVPVSGRLILDGEPLAGSWPLEIRSGERILFAYAVNGSFSTLVPRGVPVDIKLRSVTGKVVEVERLVAAEIKGVEPGSTDVVLHATRIPTDRSLTVRVASPAGRPIPGLVVRAKPVPKGAPDKIETNGSGVVKFAGLAAISTTLTVMLSANWASEHRWLAPARTEVTPNGQEIELRLRETIELQGVVVGFPSGCQVIARLNKWRIHDTRADEKGRFVLLFPREEPGPYEVSVVWRDKTGVSWVQLVTVTDVRSFVRIEKR